MNHEKFEYYLSNPKTDTFTITVNSEVVYYYDLDNISRCLINDVLKKVNELCLEINLYRKEIEITIPLYFLQIMDYAFSFVVTTPSSIPLHKKTIAGLTINLGYEDKIIISAPNNIDASIKGIFKEIPLSNYRNIKSIVCKTNYKK